MPGGDTGETDERWMRRALELAARAEHRTSPNPMVGCVIVRSGQVVGEGYHERAGLPHAEVVALETAGPAARGATMYVTLEPCAHIGRTPPCAQRIVRAGIARVLVAEVDPDWRTNGAGVAALRAGGVSVEVGAGAEEASRLNAGYLHHRRTGRPLVSAKFAASLDGRIATRTGDSRWITSEEARAHAHRLRHEHDAVLVGIGTVLADDPKLTARFPGARQPLKVVLDRRGRTPSGARVRGGPAQLMIDDGRDLPGLLARLGKLQVLSLLVEGGAGVHGSFFDAGLVDRVYAYLSPSIIGGGQAIGAVAGNGAGTVLNRVRLCGVGIERLGPDILIYGDVHRDR